MTHNVVVTPQARIELYETAIWWAENRDVDQAQRWLVGIERRIAELNERPQQHPLARESIAFPVEFRQVTFGLGSRPTHRIVFEVHGEEVVVHAIRHVAQDDLSPDDLQHFSTHEGSDEDE